MRRTMLVVKMVLAMAAVCRAGDAVAYKTPSLRVPRLSSPPTVDGKIEPGEYNRAAALTGIVAAGHGSENSLVTMPQDVTWYVCYDENYLYLAMSSPLRPGTWPRAQAKNHDSENILWDDHIEVEISPHDRTRALQEGHGFYKIIANARGAWQDTWFYNGTPGSELIWDTGGEVRCHVGEGLWQLEMSVAIKAMGLDSLDNKSLLMQLVRADHSIGAYFAGIVGSTWKGFDRYFEMRCEPEPPVFRFLRRGKLREGRLDLDVELLGGAANQSANFFVRLDDPEGKTVFERDVPLTLDEGKAARVSVDEPVELPIDKNYQLYVRATADLANPRTGETNRLMLYENRIPMAPLTPERFQQFVVPWMERVPKEGEYRWDFQYWPSYGLIYSTMDIDFFGMPAALEQAAACEVELIGPDGAVLRKGRAPMVNKLASVPLEGEPLPDGEYKGRMRLYGADGKTVVAEGQSELSVKRYDFEGNRIGLDEIIIAPYEPLRVHAESRSVSPILREYQLDASGLPAKIAAGGDGGMEQILTGPIRLEGECDGVPVTLTEPTFAFGDLGPAVAPVTAGGRLGDSVVAIEGRIEQDGWYDVRLTVSPAAGTARLDRLTLVIPLWKGADTMYIHRLSDGIEAWKGAIPRGKGLVWSSKELLPMPSNREYWGSFVPIVFAGNGDKGVWWFAEECRDWQHASERGAVEYVRTEQGVDLRVNFFAGPVTLDRERQLHFALLVDPVKKDTHRRPSGGPSLGLIFGWRWWGRSGDGYYITDGETKALDDLLRNRNLRPEIAPRAFHYHPHMIQERAERGAAAVEKDGEITLYGSNCNGGHDLPELDTYYGEWLVGFKPDNTPLPENERAWNFQGSYRLQRRREMMETTYNWTQSKIDCFIWYHEKLLRETPVTGTWWDNASSFLINDYDPERKEFYQKFSVFARRQVMKRLNVICQKLGRRMSWTNNQGADWSWNQYSWHVENGFQVFGGDDSILDRMTVDQFRALFRIRRGITHRIDVHGTFPSGDPKEQTVAPEKLLTRGRVNDGLCLLHDIASHGGSGSELGHLMKRLDELVGYRDADTCAFNGYWRTGGMVRMNTAGVYASVYRGKDRAVIVLFNSGKEARHVWMTFTDELLGRKRSKAWDGETGKPFGDFWGEFGEYQRGMYTLGGLDFRLIVVE